MREIYRRPSCIWMVIHSHTYVTSVVLSSLLALEVLSIADVVCNNLLCRRIAHNPAQLIFSAVQAQSYPSRVTSHEINTLHTEFRLIAAQEMGRPLLS
jgi:hypothetical protein